MGRRGEGWFALQMVLLGIIVLAPRIPEIVLPAWVRALGAFTLLAGGAAGAWALLALGRNLTPFPAPVEGGTLVVRGPYQIVRHPVYSGLVFGALGLGIARSNLLGVVLAGLLFIFFDLKAQREEKWLAQAYPGYPDYQRRVRKLLPYIY